MIEVYRKENIKVIAREILYIRTKTWRGESKK